VKVPPVKPLIWIGSSREDLKTFPEEVRLVMGYALYLAQTGGKHPDAKPLKGFGGARVLEVVDDFKGNAYRAMYTLKLEGAVYVLHAFQKKSRKGIQTSQADIELVKRRLSRAAEIHGERFGRSKGGRQ
jgi:phage-related protein